MVESKKEVVEDVQMKSPAPESTESSSAIDEAAKKVERENFVIEELREHAKQIEKAVSAKEQRFILRILRSLNATRKNINATILRRAISLFYQNVPEQRQTLLAYIEEPMETETTTTASSSSTSTTTKLKTKTLSPEQDVYFHLLVVLYLLDLHNYKSAITCSDLLMKKICKHNRRTLDVLAAKAYYYHTRCYELNGQLNETKSFFHSRLQTATLRNDYEGQAVLLNSLLRIYLHYNLYDQASKLVSKSTFPESASNNEWARFFYYMGRIKAIQLEYSEARKNLLQAIRKAPQQSAIGFKQIVHKLAITVDLLLGDIPERAIFRDPALHRPLTPYFQLTQAVRTGNLKRFNEVLNKFGPKFQADHTYTLIIRLRHNVIKTAIRMINQSYSRIYLKDISEKLMLDNVEDAEYIVSKAIRDGVIEATIDHEREFMRSKETTDIYCTSEPLNAFNSRISFCLDIHNQSVKAMRFPPRSYNKDLESAEDRREREQQDLEYAKEMADEEDDGFA
ncbi:regulatory particle non-ATPase 3 isoform X1 [Dermatophagoides pteronyssinus]|uniref:26S proteasome non-ATPase regulatory subunit 3 n=2 Tax=Dermatophagoides pteronyssinus TaxID=6956 RepID=A0ABQ8IQF8_DERPT|nr:probable 26S proteasome non-ATPase regulatory subunit 3 isoform X1 [Dermatophagoides pteronyssinus]KAH9412555.1 26S proteasome non-ATPase regulatory subunit 3 [Dermatophagoides pteronyssinus]